MDPNLSNSGVQGFKSFSTEEEEDKDNTAESWSIGGVRMKVLKIKLGRQLGQVIKTLEVLEK